MDEKEFSKLVFKELNKIIRKEERIKKRY